MTAAVDQISGKEIAKRPVANVIQGLQGLSPGLNITYPGGKPGATPDINIRGLGTVTGGGAPLIIIDNVSIDHGRPVAVKPRRYCLLYGLARCRLGSYLWCKGIIWRNTDYHPAGRQRRPAAGLLQQLLFLVTAVGCASADHGPIYLCTGTKKFGIAGGKTWGDGYVYYEPWQYEWARERSDNPSVEDTRINPDDPSKWTYMGSNNWNDYFFNKASFSQNHSVSLSGGSEIGRGKPFGYLVSADYTKENGLNKLAKDDWNRYALRARVNFTPFQGFKSRQ
ncbi:MAG: TonB-dependent receptor plug domain-containing protein [Luteolibacter sp.]